MKLNIVLRTAEVLELSVQPTIDTQEVVNMVCKELSIPPDDAHCFALWICDQTEKAVEVQLKKVHKPKDFMDQWLDLLEEMCPAAIRTPGSEVCKFVFRRNCFMHRMAEEKITNEVTIGLLFTEACERVKRNIYLVDQKDAVALAGLELQSRYGDRNEKLHTKAWLNKEVGKPETLMPRRFASKASSWLGKVFTAHGETKGKSRVESQRAYLSLLRFGYKAYSCTFFHGVADTKYFPGAKIELEDQRIIYGIGMERLVVVAKDGPLCGDVLLDIVYTDMKFGHGVDGGAPVLRIEGKNGERKTVHSDLKVSIYSFQAEVAVKLIVTFMSHILEVHPQLRQSHKRDWDHGFRFTAEHSLLSHSGEVELANKCLYEVSGQANNEFLKTHKLPALDDSGLLFVYVGLSHINFHNRSFGFRVQQNGLNSPSIPALESEISGTLKSTKLTDIVLFGPVSERCDTKDTALVPLDEVIKLYDGNQAQFLQSLCTELTETIEGNKSDRVVVVSGGTSPQIGYSHSTTLQAGVLPGGKQCGKGDVVVEWDSTSFKLYCDGSTVAHKENADKDLYKDASRDTDGSSSTKRENKAKHRLCKAVAAAMGDTEVRHVFIVQTGGK